MDRVLRLEAGGEIAIGPDLEPGDFRLTFSFVAADLSDMAVAMFLTPDEAKKLAAWLYGAGDEAGLERVLDGRDRPSFT